MNRSTGGATAILATALVAFSTTAASQSRDDGPGKDEIWSVSLGGGAMYRPDYEGSDDYEFRGLPMIGISYRDIILVRGPGVMVDLVQLSGSKLAENLSFGPLVRFDSGRDANDNPILRQLGDIDEGAVAGLFASYELGPIQLGLTAAQDATSRYEGMIAEIQAGYGFMLAKRLRAQFEISATWASDDYAQAFFGITEAQARASGLREFTANGGVKDAAASASLHYIVSEHWRVTGRLSYKRLLDDAADSPLVEDEGSQNQANAALLVSYQF